MEQPSESSIDERLSEALPEECLKRCGMLALLRKPEAELTDRDKQVLKTAHEEQRKGGEELETPIDRESVLESIATMALFSGCEMPRHGIPAGRSHACFALNSIVEYADFTTYRRQSYHGNL